MNHRACFALCALSTACLLGSSVARAQDASPGDASTEPVRRLTWNASPSTTEKGAATDDISVPKQHAEERPFAFLLDPSTPSPGDVGLTYDLGAASGKAADRPLPSSITVAGVTHQLTIDYGMGERVAPFATVRVLQPIGTAKDGGAGAAAGVRWQLTEPRSSLRLTLAGAGFREAEGSFGTYARLAGSYDIDRLRVAGNVHVEKVFATGRDSVDVLMLAGMSYRVMQELRLGVEYVGQDLEEAFGGEDSAEGGARHYLGPSVSLSLLSDRLQLVAGAGMGLVANASGTMGRIGTLMMF